MPDQSGSLTSALSAEAYLPACMSLLAGTVDVTGWLTLGGVFTAHITGNLVVIAAAIVQGRHPRAAQTLAVPVFVAAVIVADLIARRMGSDPRVSSTHLLSLQTALLGGAFLLSVLRVHGDAASKHLSLLQAMLAVSAMATQNALLHLTRKTVPTTAVMTGNLVEATIAALEVSRSNSRRLGEAHWKATWPLLLCFVLGCMLGAASVRLAAHWAWLVPAGLSLLYVLWFCTTDLAIASPTQGLTT